jgi:hypothetical protein
VEEKKKERMSLVRQRQGPEQRMDRERERETEREREGRREGRLSRHSLKIVLNKKYCAVLSMRSEVTVSGDPQTPESRDRLLSIMPLTDQLRAVLTSIRPFS